VIVALTLMAMVLAIVMLGHSVAPLPDVLLLPT
jgi:hypothetical protein